MYSTKHCNLWLRMNHGNHKFPGYNWSLEQIWSICKDLVARLQNGTVHIAEKFACLQILYDCDPRRLMRWSLLVKPSDLFSTVGLDEKTVGEFDGLDINFIYVEGILNGPPLLAFFLFVATEWYQRAEAITSILY